MSSIRKNLILMLFVLVVGAVGWFAWNSRASRTVYTGHHGHSLASHDHPHTHGVGIDHGHEHPSMASDTETHSHPHRHNRHQHDEIEIPGQEGLTEIGHSHDSDLTIRFWAKVTAEEGALKLEFFKSMGSDLEPTAPSKTTLTSLIFNGSELEDRAKFEISNGVYVAQQPDGFHCLPTHIVKMEDLEFGNQEFDAAIPLSQQTNE